MSDELTDTAYNKNNWTIETWMHSKQKPITNVALAPIAADLSLNQWHHVAVVKNANAAAAKTYINGEEVLNEYTIEYETRKYSNTEYYVVKPRGMVGNRDFNWDDMIAWSVKTFGPSKGVWDQGERWYCNNARFYFQDKKDRDWFVMRFS